LEESLMARTVRSAAASERDRVVAVIVMAFSADPVARWSFPDPQGYLRDFPDLVMGFGGRAFEHGTAYCASDLSGAALWLPPGVEPPEDQMIALLKRAVPERLQEDAFGLFAQMGNHHPAEPHWYLPLIGVDPARLGRGCGSALMALALAPCDRDGQLAYLESTNPRNITLYERHGFEAIGTIQAGSSPTIVPMLRKPRPRMTRPG
jgi:ribosomal protein S18 acetylase RimI-like enzyme